MGKLSYKNYRFNGLIVFISLSILTSCSNSYQESKDTSLPIKNHYVITVNDFLNAPLTLSLISKEKWQADSLFEEEKFKELKYSFDNTFVIVEDDKLKKAVISNSEVKLINDIHVGMSYDDFTNNFKDLKNNADKPFIEVSGKHVMISCCANKKEIWNFEFQTGILVMITFQSNDS